MAGKASIYKKNNFSMAFCMDIFGLFNNNNDLLDRYQLII